MRELDPSNYSKVEALVNEVPFNTLFAQVVLQRMVHGRVLVDDEGAPSVCVVVHRYGMALLCGSRESAPFNRELVGFLMNDSQNAGSAKWLLCYPSDWEVTLVRLLGAGLMGPTGPVDDETIRSGTIERVVRTERVNFQFNANRRPPRIEPPSGFVLRKIDARSFPRITGNVVPRMFWDDAKDFVGAGVGFSLLTNDEVVSTSFSSFIVDDQLELGVETDPRYRRRGLSLYPATELIEYCLSTGYEPVWACRKDNVPSFKLALKLGFTPSTYHPYYVLPYGRGRHGVETTMRTPGAQH